MIKSSLRVFSKLLFVTMIPGLIVAQAQTALGDTSPPSLQEFSFHPNRFDTSLGVAQVNISLRIEDDLSGLALGAVGFASPSGQHSVASAISRRDLVKGNSTNGEYFITLEFPRYSEQGTWTVQYLFVRDNASNLRHYDTQALANLGFSTSLNQTGEGDVTPPELRDLNFSHTDVNTGRQSMRVTVTADIADAPAGFWQAAMMFRSPSGNRSITGTIRQNNLVEGDIIKGRYSIVLEFPPNSEQGIWEIVVFSLRDTALNSISYVADELEALGFQTTIRVQ